MLRKKSYFIASSIMLGLLPNMAFAVGESIRGALPGAFDAGIVQQRLQTNIHPTMPLGGAKIKEETNKKNAANAAAEKIHMKLSKVTIVGNTVYSEKDLQKIFQPSIGKSISLADLQNLVADVTKKYRTDGYVLSRAILPPQTIKNGQVKVQIIEGFVSEVIYKGDSGYAIKLLKQYGDQIKSMRPLQFKILERDMLLMGDMTGLTVKSVITPSNTVPGGADLTLIADLKRESAYGAYDNFGTRFLGPQETTLGASFNSVVMPGDSNSVRMVTTAQTTQLQFYEFVHTNPIGIEGSRVTLGSNYSNTKPGFTLSGFNVIGRSFLLFGDLSKSVLRSRSDNISLHAGVNYQNVQSTILGFPFYYDPIRSLVLGGRADSIDSWHGINGLGLNLEHGFDILGAQYSPTTQSRPKGLPDFTKLSLSLSRLQGLNSRLSVLLAYQGQYAFNPLLATEQFAYGGADFGRGYDPSAIIGDSGMAAKAELRLDTAPGFRFLQTVQYYVFYDGGIIWNRDQVDLPAKQSAFSTGVGARVSIMPQISGNIFIAKPLTFPVAVFEAMGQNPHQWRGYFQVVVNL